MPRLKSEFESHTLLFHTKMAEVDKSHTDSLTNVTRQVFMKVLTFETFSGSRKVNSLKEP